MLQLIKKNLYVFLLFYGVRSYQCYSRQAGIVQLIKEYLYFFSGFEFFDTSYQCYSTVKWELYMFVFFFVFYRLRIR